VLTLLDREIERASDVERRALEALGAALHAVRGDRDLARAAYDKALAARPTDLGPRLALVDLAAADANSAPAGSGLDEIAAPLAALSEALAQSTDPRLRAALLIERARIDEAAGRLREAVARFREALTLDPQAPGAAWGLFRIAVRTPSEADDLEPHARLVEAAPRGPGRAALERRLALLRQRSPEGGGAAAARPLLVAASPDNLLAEASLLALEQSEGRLDEAAASLVRLVDLESDPGRAADLLVMLGQLQEERGNVALAVGAYQRAAQLASDDPRPRRALERARAAGGDKASELERHLAAAAERPEQAPLAWTRAARLLDELGRRDEAVARLDEALAAQPGYPPAVALAAELRLADGKPEEAAAVLLGAAEAASDDAALQASLRERAARLYARAGRVDEALAAIAPLLDGATTDGAPIRWLEQRILEAAGDAPRLARSLQAEAELAETTDRPRALQLWHAAGLLYALSSSDEDVVAAIEAQRRVLALDPQVAPAALELASLLVRRGELDEIPAMLDLRRAAAEGRPEATLAELRLALSLAEDANDPAKARALLDEAARTAAAAGRSTASYTELTDRLARRFGDEVARADALDREAGLLDDAATAEQRFALRVAAAERLAVAGQLDGAADRWQKAMALRPGHPIARAGLERTLLAARNHAALADLALADLKESNDAAKKALAYERLAFVDAELRGERDSALLSYESILETDHAHHRAMRVLERAYLETGRLADLVALYERMGLVVGDPQLGAALHLDRARLRRRIAAAAPDAAGADLEAAIDNDVRLALFKHERCRPALRHALGRARTSGDAAKEAELAARLADTVFADGDGRAAAVLDTRAAEALTTLYRAGDARALYRLANERAGGAHLPALLGLLDSALLQADWDTAEVAAAQAGAAFVQPAARARTLLVAGAISIEKLNDPRRALPTLGQALEVEPRSLEAFRRLRQVRIDLGDHAALAELYRKRLQVETDGRRLIALHLELAKLARDHLNDPALARRELQAVLTEDANHVEALKMLGDLAWSAGAWAEAAEALIKRARVEKSRSEMRDIFVKLGTIYGDQDKLFDAKRAIACWSRVSKADPSDLVALEYLSNLSLKEWDYQGALDATRRLAELDPDKLRKIAHLHRVAKIYEEGFKDARHALEAYRAALELDPMHLPSIGELARFFDRQTDVQSMRVHLDRTIARVRQLLDRDAFDPTAFHALFKIFNWRRAPDRAFMAAGILDHLGEADGDEKALLAKAHGRDFYPGSAFADPALDDTLFDARIPAGFRHLFRLLDEALSKPFRTDLKKLGVGRNERLPARGHAIRDLMNRIAGDLGLRELDLYVTSAHPTALIVEITEPLSVVLGAKLVEGAHEAEVRFYLGRMLKMVQLHMALPMRLSAEDLAIVVGAIVRQFVPDFVPAGFDEKQIAAEAVRLSKVIPKKMHQELFPFAMECASPTLDLRQLGPALVDTANRAGLLAAGTMPAALAALRRLGDEAQVKSLVRFSMSDELAELRRQLGTTIA
jgi:tetratricopeptide (TPR) repeat protein